MRNATGAILFFLPCTLHASDDMAAVQWSYACPFANATSMLFSAKLDKIAFAMLSPDLLSRLTKSKNTSLIWGRHHFVDLKALRQTLNTSWFAYLSVSSSLVIEGKAFSFWIFCGVAFDRTYAPVISRTFSCTVLEELVAFPYQWVIMCSFKSSSELLNNIRMGWKLPLFTRLRLCCHLDGL